MITAKGIDEKIYLSIDKDTNYHKKGFYKCRDCDQVVFLKRSNFRTNHFSHFPFSRMCNQWEQDTEEHTIMKVDIYNYFKNFYWVDSIDSETPIPYNDSFIKPDIFIKTKNGDKIAIECQITKITWLAVIEKIKKYSSIDIGTLFIFDKSNYIDNFFSVNTTPYDMSPTILVTDNIHNKRFYLYNANNENKKKYGPIISFEQIGMRIANRKDDKFYFFGSYFNKEDFTNYKISNIGGCKIVTGSEKPNFGKIVKKVEEHGCHFDPEWTIYDDVEDDTSKSTSTDKEKTSGTRNIDTILIKPPLLERRGSKNTRTIRIMTKPRYIKNKKFPNRYRTLMIEYAIFGREVDRYSEILHNTIYKGILAELKKNNVPIDNDLTCVVNRVFTIETEELSDRPIAEWKIDGVTNTLAPPKIYRVTLRSDLESNNKSYNFYTAKGSKYEYNFRHTVIKATVEDLEELRRLHSLDELNNLSKDFVNTNYPEWPKTKEILKIYDEPLKYFFRVGKPLIVAYQDDIYMVRPRIIEKNKKYYGT